METRDVRLIFNYTTKIAKSYNLRPEITKSKGISINSIPSLLNQLKSREENASDAEHLDYMKTSLSIYSLPLFTVPEIMEGKHKTSSTTTTTEEEEEKPEVIAITDETNDENIQTEVISEEQQEPEETVQPEEPAVEEKKSKKDKKNKKDKKEDKKDKKNDKPKGITKLEKMKEKLHKKK
ncbi:predicted protein [Naegleria gruberi]|uniref:Predicted protein n=1 Tax=Naegleria gruberi TaxID=5762 RepID=D2UY38_NAEGR|nr:uncharacterized protein NAEGRDRAFT_61334 [Naegleria gruberi]EFC50407.1 predicted protein [Naegleria gruberi]|eukprot:XP_002683151.1 predicted protein [Naegleria gruberi strain NEG-M]